jgi:TonB-dependent receptor
MYIYGMKAAPILRSAYLWLCVLIVICPFPGSLSAQETTEQGVIRGVIRDEDFGDPLSGARIVVQEQGNSATSEEGGVYRIENLSEGVYTLTVAKPGYIREIQRDVIVKPGQVTDANINLEQEVYELEPLVVQAEELLGGGEVALLELRTETSVMVDAIGADLLSKAGASDASDALKLVVGATVSEDKTATVRGLGDRYTVTTLNGARIVSSNPTKRAVELDQFPTSLVESINVSKTFLPDMQGEATGGAVDIRTKAIPDGIIAKVSASVGFDSQATGNENFRTYEGAGEPWAFDFDGDRDLPNGAYPQQLVPPTVDPARSTAQTNLYDPVMGTTTKTPGPNRSLGLELGNRFDISSDSAFGILFTLNYGKDFSFVENGQRREREVPIGGTHNPDFKNDFTYDEGTEETSFNTSLNLGYQFNEHHSVKLTTIGNLVAEDKAAILTDTGNLDGSDVNFQVDTDQTIRHRQRILGTVQLRGDHKFEEFNDIEGDWVFAQTFTRQYDPDTRRITYLENVGGGGVVTVPLGNGVFPERAWQSVEDKSTQGSLNMKVPFSTWNKEKGYIKFGPFVETVERDYDNKRVRYNNTAGTSPSSTLFFPGGFGAFFNDVPPPGSLLTDFWGDPNYLPLSAAHYYLEGDTTGSVSYTGEQLISAVYVMAEVPLTERFKVTGGIRLERTEISIRPEATFSDANGVVGPGITTFTRPAGSTSFSSTSLSINDPRVNADLTEEFWHPAISVSYEALDNMFFRFGWSKTTARPTFRELAPTLNIAIDDNADFVGNPRLIMSESYNFDFRWEWFPRPATVLAFSTFYKDIQDPIETVIGSATGKELVTKENFISGEVAGFEVEGRTSLGVIHESLADLSFGSNFALIRSRVIMTDTYRQNLIAVNNYDPDQPLTGTPEFLVNANISYDNSDTGTSMSLFWNWQGETLLAGSGNGANGAAPARYSRPFDTLNMSVSQKLADHIKLTLKAKNILNRKQEVVERLPNDSDVIFKSVTKGVDISLGLGVEW